MADEFSIAAIGNFTIGTSPIGDPLVLSGFGFPHDHEEIAWSHWLAQHVGMEYTEDFARSFYPPLNVLDKAEQDLYTKRWIDTAEGEQLDGAGSIVGQSRTIPKQKYLPFFGFDSQAEGYGFNQYRIRRARDPYSESITLDDEEYKTSIKLKIAKNSGHGTAEDIMFAVNTALDVTGTVIYDIGNANGQLCINDLTFNPTNPNAELIDQLIPRAAGVKIWPVVYNRGKTFGFANQQIYFGFGVGILARSIASNVAPIA